MAALLKQGLFDKSKEETTMPWKFIAVLIILILFVIFIGLNLEYNTNISLGFYSFDNVPAFLIVIVSFLIGAVVTLPISLLATRIKKQKSKSKAKKKLEKFQIEGDEG